MSDRPIGVFDSGVGGISVVREINRLLPHEDIVYFADQANCPYGQKPPHAIRQFSVQAAKRLLEHDAKLIVVACNTASTAALATLRETFSVPFVGMVPAVKPASASSTTGKVGVLATEATIAAAVFDDLIAQFASNVEVFRQPCPGFVDLVERGVLEGPEVDALVEHYVNPLVGKGIDRIVLGCTHFAFLRESIERAAGPGIAIVDASYPVALQTRRIVEQLGLTAQSDKPGAVTFLTSGNPEVFLPMAHRLFQPLPTYEALP